MYLFVNVFERKETLIFKLKIRKRYIKLTKSRLLISLVKTLQLSDKLQRGGQLLYLFVNVRGGGMREGVSRQMVIIKG